MKTISVHDAKTNLSKYLAEIEATGEELMIARRDKPVARLIPVEKKKVDRSGFIGSGVGILSEEAVEYLTDPFDRMFIAQAIEHNLAVMTSDKVFRDYDIQVV